MSRFTNNISALGLYAGKSGAGLKEKLLDLAEELSDNISRMRNIADGCPSHKTFRGHREPTTDCVNCIEIYKNRQYLGE